MEEIAESYEVVSQRVKDLVEYLRHSLPQLYGKKHDTKITRTDLLAVLMELDEEFSYSERHRMAVSSILSVKIAAVVEPMVAATALSQMISSSDDDDDDDDYEEESGSMEVHWSSLFPELSGDFGKLAGIAGTAVLAQLNAALWDNPSWDSIAERHTDSVKDIFELYFGMMGFLLLNTYIMVVDNKIIPPVECH